MQASSKKASERKITGGEKGRACKHLTNTAKSAHLQKNRFLYQNNKIKCQNVRAGGFRALATIFLFLCVSEAKRLMWLT